MSEKGAEKESGRGKETEQLCQPLGKESEKEKGSEKEGEVVEAEEELAMEEEPLEEVEEITLAVFRC